MEIDGGTSKSSAVSLETVSHATCDAALVAIRVFARISIWNALDTANAMAASPVTMMVKDAIEDMEIEDN